MAEVFGVTCRVCGKEAAHRGLTTGAYSEDLEVNLDGWTNLEGTAGTCEECSILPMDEWPEWTTVLLSDGKLGHVTAGAPVRSDGKWIQVPGEIALRFVVTKDLNKPTDPSAAKRYADAMKAQRDKQSGTP
jgi:hypothetical protein